MFPLIDILDHSYTNHMSYIWRKTNFLLKSNEGDQLRWFCQHVTRHCNYQEFWKELKKNEKKTFFELLSHFCYFSSNYLSQRDHHAIEEIEKKSMWIFKHPIGGVYIPAEVIKVFMDEPALSKKNFLFSILYRLKFKEQLCLSALIRNTFNGSEIITNEKNPKDMALAIYMLFANLHTTGFHNYSVQKSNAIVNINTKILDSHRHNFSVLETPTPLWDYLYQEYAHMRLTLDEWYYLMKYGKKGFYRSLALVSKPKSEFLYLFSSGYLLPMMPKKNGQPDKIKAITPIEVAHIWNQQSVDPGFRAGDKIHQSVQ